MRTLCIESQRTWKVGDCRKGWTRESLCARSGHALEQLAELCPGRKAAAASREESMR